MLTPAQLTTIDYHLREVNLLTDEELILELTDHYTTAIAERIAQGMAFETALTDTQQAFGGRKGLQKMERQYNRVTFKHYDEQWRQALISQFQKPLLWRQTIPSYALLLLFSFVVLLPDPIAEPKWVTFSEGMLTGLFSGVLISILGMLWPYMKATFQHGFHNVPAETLYLMKRRSILMLIIYSTGIMGYFWLLPLLPVPIQAILVSLYFASLCLFMLTSHFMQELLYEYVPSR
ncbi:hypothetical protein GCM10028808_64720 [Spirosoma migulaei]